MRLYSAICFRTDPLEPDRTDRFSFLPQLDSAVRLLGSLRRTEERFGAGHLDLVPAKRVVPGTKELEKRQDLPAALLRFRHGPRPFQENPQLGHFVCRDVLDHCHREMAEMQCLEFPCRKSEG